MVNEVAEATGSKTAWDNLRNAFEPKGPMTQVLVRRKLFRTQCDEGGNVEEHVRTLRGHQREYNSISPTSRISEEDFSLILLTSLPDSWNTFVAAIDIAALGDSNVLIARILAEDQRIKSRNPDQAFAAKFQNRKFNPNIKCFGCDQPGYIRKFCPKCKDKPQTGKPRNRRKTEKANSAEDGTEQNFTFLSQEEMTLAGIDSDAWLADSATTSHLVRHREWFQNIVDTPGQKVKGLGNIPAHGRGTVKIKGLVGGKQVVVTLTEALLTPDAPHNLISIGRLTKHGATVTFTENGVKFVTKSGTPFMEGKAAGTLFEVQAEPMPIEKAHVTMTGRTWDQWHRILGHINMDSVKTSKEKEMVTGMEVDRTVPASDQCETCIQAKHHVTPFPKEAQRSYSRIGEMTYTDLWGPARTTAIGGFRYYQSFLDGASNRIMIYFLKDKTDQTLLEKLEAYRSFILTQKGEKLKRIRVDNEFGTPKIKGWAQRNGIQLELTAAHSPSQNGPAERLNRTIVELARALLIQHNLPYTLWAEAVAYVCFIRNRSPTRSLKVAKTPHEVFWGEKPDISLLREFGTKCWVLQQDKNRQKLDPKSRQFLFTGTGDDSRAYRYYNPATHQIQTSRNVIFETPTAEKGTADVIIRYPPLVEGGSLDDNPPVEPDNSQTTPDLPRQSGRIANKPRPDYRQMDNPAARPKKKDQGTDQETTLFGRSIGPDPVTVGEAKARNDWPEWKDAMDKEMQSLWDKGTWKLTELPKDRQAIPSKWVFTTKLLDDGETVKHKARLVAKGFIQIPGTDYLSTYSPAISMDTLHLIIAIATQLDLELHHVDVKSAYLNGKLDEEIYLTQPQEYEDGTPRVARLLKAIYGLKQAGRVWNQLLNHTFTELGYQRSAVDPCLYYRRKPGELVIVGVHVDDMPLAANGITRIKDAKAEIAGKFEITDLDELTRIVGLEVKRDRKNRMTYINQNLYIRKVLDRFNMSNCNPVKTPLDLNVKLRKRDNPERDPKMANIPYQELIGSLLYAARGTRPDISFAVQHLSQFLSNPSIEHWTQAKRVLRYLKGTIDLGIKYSADAKTPHPYAYSDADWGADLSDRRSVSGYVFKLANGPIAWSSKKQPTVALSSMEAEYMALSHTARHASWLRSISAELGNPLDQPMLVLTDNESAIDHAADTMTTSRSKHIDIQHHYIRDEISTQRIEINYCESRENAADLFTKKLAAPLHWEMIARLGMSSELKGGVAESPPTHPE